ncbi:pyruvate dehydrogenase protein X component, mitochondrial [Trichonephila inaurata madagascariensis]|uniref:Dihydrolipoamide acetyltransferase component of pyruvate dehydrogenase complex n=1 Tax=Trichonephila inaurata madagascariensis TaxID=2747483 RepID=A0A8X6X966_9ARAC|nr:pyruvate dehydrogenase protein X component, mitochondrial [Trichonephila inaurata madagascariensis]
MLSLRCILFRTFGSRANLVKPSATKVRHQYAFFHFSRLLLGENTTEIKMPSLSPTMTEGTIVKWLKKEGDSISPGDVICEIQTDKAIVGLEVEEEGVLSKILIPEDTKNVQLGEVIAVIVGEGDFETEKEKPIQTPVESSPPVEADVTHPKPIKRDYHVCGPSVKKLLTEYGIKYSDIPVSGPKGNVLKGDVLQFIQDKKLKKVSIKVEDKAPKVQEYKLTEGVSHIDIPTSSARRTAAKQLIHSKTAMPHAYMNVDCTINKLFDFIKTMKQKGSEVSFNDFLIKSVATALRKVPEMNIINLNGQVKPLNTINILITIANNDGYLTATVKNADDLTVQHISEQMNSLSAHADGWKIENEKFLGGSFRISNLGMIGVSEFNAVIYPPEVAVLTVGTVQCGFEEEMPVRKVRVTLSFNNELISENVAGSFLNNLKQCLENPLSLCLS